MLLLVYYGLGGKVFSGVGGGLHIQVDISVLHKS